MTKGLFGKCIIDFIITRDAIKKKKLYVKYKSGLVT